MSEQDYPAAHSMDTEWYAVDRDGRLGRFSTGEAGGVPTSATQYSEGAENGATWAEDAVFEIVTREGAEYEVDDLIQMPGGPVFNFSWGGGYETASFTDAAACYHVLMLLRDENVFSRLPRPSEVSSRARERSGRARAMAVHRIYNSKHVLGYPDGPLPVGTLQQWIQNGWVLKAWVNHSLTPIRAGIFEYDHGDVFENWISGLYLREGIPLRPLNVRDLPEFMRRYFENTRFTLRSFAKDVAIDPREAGTCTNWEPDWVGWDGIVHRQSDEELD